MYRRTINVDFDGVLHSYKSGWKGVDVAADPPVDGAIAWLVQMVEIYNVDIYSSRSQDPRGIAAMRQAIARWAGATMTPSEVSTFMAKLSFPSHKGPAWISIDDRCFLFEGRFPTSEEIDNFTPWNKRGDRNA